MDKIVVDYDRIKSNIGCDIKAAIFDLDGTLIDTERIYKMIWPKALKEMGIEMKMEHYYAMRSLGRPFAPLKMKEWYGDTFDYDEARRIRKGYFEEYIAEHGIQQKQGAIELLDYLRDKGIVTAIATATDIERATDYMKMAGVDGYFDKIISATMVKEGKPSPYVYLYACEQLGLNPEVCIAIEDAPNGITSAYKAGCKVLMVPDQTGVDDYVSPMIVGAANSLDEICRIL